MTFLTKGSNPLKIQKKSKLEFSFEIYNLKSREILELDQKGKLCHLKLSISRPSLEQ
jgi:hypothetical protein